MSSDNAILKRTANFDKSEGFDLLPLLETESATFSGTKRQLIISGLDIAQQQEIKLPPMLQTANKILMQDVDLTNDNVKNGGLLF